MPPITTTTNATPRISGPTKGWAPRKGANSTPATPARATPRAKVMENKRKMLVPSSDTVSVLSLPARTNAPKRVHSSSSHNVSPISPEKTIRNKR
ncbi:hypothetical protein D3C87_1555080 [compost metagenome]